MDTVVSSESYRVSGGDRQFPAYGPIEAILGYGLFYFLVDRVTPAVVTVFSETVLDMAPSFVRFALAVALWFILVVTAIDQLRHQLAALGVGFSDEYRLRVWSRVTPQSLRTAGYLVTFVAGSVVAAVTFDRALAALLSLIPSITTLDLLELLVMVVFFLAYSVAAHSLDRLVIDAIRALIPQ